MALAVAGSTKGFIVADISGLVLTPVILRDNYILFFCYVFVPEKADIAFLLAHLAIFISIFLCKALIFLYNRFDDSSLLVDS